MISYSIWTDQHAQVANGIIDDDLDDLGEPDADMLIAQTYAQEAFEWHAHKLGCPYGGYFQIQESKRLGEGSYRIQMALCRSDGKILTTYRVELQNETEYA